MKMTIIPPNMTHADHETNGRLLGSGICRVARSCGVSGDALCEVTGAILCLEMLGNRGHPGRSTRYRLLPLPVTKNWMWQPERRGLAA